MDLKIKSDEIAQAFEKRKNDVLSKAMALRQEREQAYEEYRLANTGDRSENAPLDAAIEHMKKVNASILLNDKEIKRLNEVPDISRYNSVGMVVVFSTVHLRCNGEEYVYRIYPKDVSFIEDGIIASNSRLASVLMRKRAGDVVEVEDSSTGYINRWEIIDVY